MYSNVEKSQSNLENNIVHIFAKENTLSKQLKRKLRRPDVLPKKIVMFGCHFKQKEIWVLTVLSFFFSVSFIAAVIMWWTSSFDNFLLSQFILINNSAAFQRWKDPPVKSFLKVHIFNYTNVEDYRSGLDDKLHVEDVGPFVYEEISQKTNIKFHSNSSISYQEFHSHTFRPDLSQSRKETDRVIVPNLSVLGAAAVTKDYFYVTRLAVSAVMRGLNAEPFLNLAAERFLWGYDDRLFELAKAVLSFKQKLPFEKFGIIASRSGTSENIITVHSGVNDLSNIAQIERVNGKDYMPHWGTSDCNRVEGSDGISYPVFEVRKKRTVNVYFPEICRRIPLVYKENVKLMNDQIDAYRYGIKDTIFDRPEVEPGNQCYCDAGICSPQGVFNISKCAFGAPASISFPHFYKADPSLQKGVSGLNPNAEKHSTFMDLHPRFAFPMGAKYRLQLNVQVKKSTGMSQLDMFEDDIYLPVVWVEAGIDSNDLPEVLKDDIMKASITLPAFENAIKYGFLILAMATFICIVVILARKIQARSRQVINLQRISIVFS